MFAQIAGGIAIAGIAFGAAWLASKGYPVPAAIGVVVSGLIGKLFGEPLPSVTLNAVASMPPPMAAEVAKRAIASLPPDARTQLAHAQVVLTGLTTPPPAPEQTP